jgi:hypothetical protein
MNSWSWSDSTGASNRTTVSIPDVSQSDIGRSITVHPGGRFIFFGWSGNPWLHAFNWNYPSTLGTRITVPFIGNGSAPNFIDSRNRLELSPQGDTVVGILVSAAIGTIALAYRLNYTLTGQVSFGSFLSAPTGAASYTAPYYNLIVRPVK